MSTTLIKTGFVIAVWLIVVILTKYTLQLMNVADDFVFMTGFIATVLIVISAAIGTLKIVNYKPTKNKTKK
jgi:DMSO/TMAO reductase YedYZ heme-binding membrane subunit